MMPWDALSGFDDAPTIAMVVASVSSCFSSWSGGFWYAIPRAYIEQPRRFVRDASQSAARAPDEVGERGDREHERLDAELAAGRIRQQPENHDRGEHRDHRTGRDRKRNPVGAHVAPLQHVGR